MGSDLNTAIQAGKTLGKLALYFGCWKSAGHHLRDASGRYADRHGMTVELPWSLGLMDSGLLKNGKHADVPSGNVYWTCGGAGAFWYAFYWWDRSIDKRGGSNSGFYVRGFGYPEAQAAFDYACSQFPDVVKRQYFPLALQVDWRRQSGSTP